MLVFGNDKKNVTISYDETIKKWSDDKAHSITVEQINGFFIDGKQVASRAYITSDYGTLSMRNFAANITALNELVKGNFIAKPKREKSEKTKATTTTTTAQAMPITIDELAKVTAVDLPTECVQAVNLYTLRTHGDTMRTAISVKIDELTAKLAELEGNLENAKKVTPEDAERKYAQAVAVYKAQCEKRDAQKAAHKQFLQATKTAVELLGVDYARAVELFKEKNPDTYALASAYAQILKNEGK